MSGVDTFLVHERQECACFPFLIHVAVDEDPYRRHFSVFQSPHLECFVTFFPEYQIDNSIVGL